MREKLKKLIDVKSIITLTFTIIFNMLALRNKINIDYYVTIYNIIIAFYFGTQTNKRSE